MPEIIFKSDGLEGFKERVLKHARALDDGEMLPSETTYSFDSPAEMLRILTRPRIHLLEKLASDGKQPVNMLAKKLRRTNSAVIRDLAVLKKIGVVRTSFAGKIPHKSVLFASAAATRYDFVCSILDRKTAHTNKILVKN
jgi:predicted transcriptional regulator